MNQPILVKENKQLITQLENEILKLLQKFREDTGLLVLDIEIQTIEHQVTSTEILEVIITRMMAE